MNSTHLASELSFEYRRSELREVRSNIDLQAFSSAVQAAQNTDQLKSILARTLRGARVEFLELSTYRRSKLSSVVWSELSNLGNSDCQRCMQPFSDVYARRAMMSGRPELWEITSGDSTSLGNVAWLTTLRAHAIGHGVTIAIHGANDRRFVFHFGRDHSHSFDADGVETSIVSTTAFIVSQRLAYWNDQAAGPTTMETALSDRELEVLRWSKDGKSYLEIARILGISHKTVEFHIANAMRKLGVNQKLSAIVAAAREGLIDL